MRQSISIVGAAMLLFCAGALGGENFELRVVRRNKPIQITNAASLVSNVIAFAQSASVNLAGITDDEPGSRRDWEQALLSDSFIYLRFQPARKLQIMPVENQNPREQLVSEILVTLPEGHYPAIKVKSDNKVMKLTKYDPKALKRLVMDPALDLSSVSPYDHFNNMP